MPADVAQRGGYNGTPAANLAEIISKSTRSFARSASYAAAVCWLFQLATNTVQLNLLQMGLYVGCLAAWVITGRLCLNEDLIKHVQWLSVFSARPILITPMCPWLSLLLNFFTLYFCFSEKLPGWKGVQAVFFVNVFIVVMIWAARSVAYCAIPRNQKQAAIHAARRANKITTWSLAITAVLWLIPIILTLVTPGTPFLHLPLFIVVAIIFGYAYKYSKAAEEYRVQYGLLPNTYAALMLGVDGNSFVTATRLAYTGYAFSVVVLAVCIYLEAPQIMVAQGMFTFELIALAAIIGARVTAARSYFAQCKVDLGPEQQDQVG